MRAHSHNSMVLLLLVLAGCEPGSWQPVEAPDRAVVETPTVLASGLESPSALAWLDGSWYLLNGDGSQLAEVPQAGGEAVSVLDDLSQAADLAAGEAELAVAETGNGTIRLVSADGSSTELFSDAQTAPFQLIATESGWAWLAGLSDAGGGLWSYDSALGAAIEQTTGFSDPRGLAVSSSGWVVGDEGSERGVFVVSAEGDAPSLIASVPEQVRDLATDSTGHIYFTGLSDRWPGGGWVYGADDSGDALEALSYSPPGLGRIEVFGDWIYWASKEAITRAPREGGTYEVLAHQTRVADFAVQAGQLVWLDSDRGELLAVDLP